MFVITVTDGEMYNLELHIVCEYKKLVQKFDVSYNFSLADSETFNCEGVVKVGSRGIELVTNGRHI